MQRLAVPDMPAVNALLLAKAVIDTRNEIVEVIPGDVSLVVKVVLPGYRTCGRRVRRGIQVHNLLSDRIDSFRGNLVVGELIAHPIVSDQMTTQWVIDRHKLPLRVERLREIALPLLKCRHRRYVVLRENDVLLIGLPRREEECTILAVVDLGNPHRPTEAESILVEGVHISL